MRRNGNDRKDSNLKDSDLKDSGRVRFTAYVSREAEAHFFEEKQRAAKVEDLRNLANGIIERWMKYLRLDRASIAEYTKTHTKTYRQRRDQTPARN